MSERHIGSCHPQKIRGDDADCGRMFIASVVEPTTRRQTFQRRVQCNNNAETEATKTAAERLQNRLHPADKTGVVIDLSAGWVLTESQSTLV
jgi:hypothetical protein